MRLNWKNPLRFNRRNRKFNCFGFSISHIFYESIQNLSLHFPQVQHIFKYDKKNNFNLLRAVVFSLK